MESDPAYPFGFSTGWFALGLVPTELLDQMRAKWDTGEDRNPEHYRYWAFEKFLPLHRPLTSELAAALFELGAADSDQAMGGSMMADIVRLPECPEAVFAAALASGRKHLIRMVERRRAAPGTVDGR